MIEFIKQTKFPQSKQWHYRYFECERCGFFFKEHLASDVHSCKMCGYPCIAHGKTEHDYINQFGHLIHGLNDYEKMKYYGLKSPVFFKDNVKRRKIVKEGDKQKIYLTDSSGAKIGEMPKAFEL